MILNRFIRMLTSRMAQRLLIMKALVSFTFVAWIIHPSLAAPVAVVGNLVWLWLIPDFDHNKLRVIVEEYLDEMKEIEYEIRGQS